MAAEQLRVEPARALVGHIAVPEFQIAAPFVVGASLLAGSELTLHEVGLDQRRSRLLDVLGRMGARISIFNRRRSRAPVGDLEVRSTELVAVTVPEDETRAVLDELPLLALAAGCARGDTVVSGAAELRKKETDRIESVSISLKALGVRISEREDGFGVRGVPTRPKGGGMDARGDHRLAMMGAVAGLVSREGVRLQGAEAVAVSFPGFFDLLESVTQR
jgi:3-phosphoshikimate 1-carboxyvinyltransferase